jgi:hypothetical protein
MPAHPRSKWPVAPAIECAHEQGAKFCELQATTWFARWLKSQGSAAEAHQMLAEILQLLY